MLHIILLILKIIGIILAVILGILILLVCIALFVPVCYRATGSSSGDVKSLQGCVRVTWLFRLISVYISYEEQMFTWKVRVAFKTWRDVDVEEVSSASEQESMVMEEGDEERENTEKKREMGATQISPEESEQVSSFEEQVLNYGQDFLSIEESPQVQQKIKKPKKRKRFSEFLYALFQKVKLFFHKIKYTITKIYDTIIVILKRKETITRFLEYEIHQKAFGKVKKELFRLLRHLKPKKLKMYLHYGFEDPCITGQVLAGVSILYPFLSKDTVVVPDFEKTVLDGSILVRGKLYGMHFIAPCIRLLLSKHIRITYRHIRNMQRSFR